MANQSIATSVATKSFNFDSFAVRAINRNGDIWFVAADVCAALEIQNVTQALQSLDDDEYSMFNIGKSERGNPNVNIINESGLYALILRSRKPEAKRFRKWVTSEVLPAIRKTGAYVHKAYKHGGSDKLSAEQADTIRDALRNIATYCVTSAALWRNARNLLLSPILDSVNTPIALAGLCACTSSQKTA